MNQDGTRSGELPDYQKGAIPSLVNDNGVIGVSIFACRVYGTWIETMFAAVLKNGHNCPMLLFSAAQAEKAPFLDFRGLRGLIPVFNQAIQSHSQWLEMESKARIKSSANSLHYSG